MSSRRCPVSSFQVGPNPEMDDIVERVAPLLRSFALAIDAELGPGNYGFLVVDTEGDGTALAFASMAMPEIVAASRRGTPAGAWGQRYACCAFALETLHQFHATSGGSEAAWLGAMADRRSVETVTMIVTDASVGLARVLLSVPMSKGGSA